MTEDLAYPVGRFAWEGPGLAASRVHRIDEIAAAPAALRKAVAGLTEPQDDWPLHIETLHAIASLDSAS